MLILVTNDDGIYAPGLGALSRALTRLGEVCVVAPATEQSGVSHAITYLTPLIIKEVFHGDQPWGWAVQGSPADCVKIGTTEICPRMPDLIVSGINSGFNAGINVLYSGTVAAAIEGAFYGVTSFAVSLEFDEQADYDRAAALACRVVEQALAQKGSEPQLYNMNIPQAALHGVPQVSVVPMDVVLHHDRFEKRFDPWGREYFWLVGSPPAAATEQKTDLTELTKGHVTLTPLDYNMTRAAVVAQMEGWQFDLGGVEGTAPPSPVGGPPMMRTQRKVSRKR
ncbi:MAG: 5'/3'-nucleotidase SurE [Patescibacteria group bacterium]|nr:5'/3'-nucleotidase SurE [Patescibacteria group bacterium]